MVEDRAPSHLGVNMPLEIHMRCIDVCYRHVTNDVEVNSGQVAVMHKARQPCAHLCEQHHLLGFFLRLFNISILNFILISSLISSSNSSLSSSLTSPLDFSQARNLTATTVLIASLMRVQCRRFPNPSRLISSS